MKLTIFSKRSKLCILILVLMHFFGSHLCGQWPTAPTSLISGGPSVPGSPAALVVNGNPATAYGAGNTLYYRRSLDPTGSGWGPAVPVDVLGGQGMAEGIVNLLLVQGKPAIAYHSLSTRALMYVRALDADGDTWGTPVVVDGNPAFYKSWSSMEIINGNPAIAYRGGNSLLFVRANDGSGSSWGSPLTLDAAGITGIAPSLSEVNGRPAISYGTYIGSTSGELRYIRAIDAAGASWPAHQAIVVNVRPDWMTSMKLVGGKPAIAYTSLWGCYYVRADDVDGNAWGTPLNVDATRPIDLYNRRNHVDMEVIDGNPAIAFSHGYAGYSRTNVVRATDPAGNSWNDLPEEMGTYLNWRPDLFVVDGRAAVVNVQHNYQVAYWRRNSTYCQSPTISCPADVTLNTTPGMCGADYQFAATATGSGTVISYSQAPGAFFAPGSTSVTATATNACGSHSCTFTVSVIDAEPPSVTCQDAGLTLSTSGFATLSPAQVMYSSADNCGSIASEYLSKSLFTTADVGTQTVALTLTDDAGNSGQCNAVVTIQSVSGYACENASIVRTQVAGLSCPGCNGNAFNVHIANARSKLESFCDNLKNCAIGKALNDLKQAAQRLESAKNMSGVSAATRSIIDANLALLVDIAKQLAEAAKTSAAQKLSAGCMACDPGAGDVKFSSASSAADPSQQINIFRQAFDLWAPDGVCNFYDGKCGGLGCISKTEPIMPSDVEAMLVAAPNPFTDLSTIIFSVNTDSWVRLSIMDLSGKVVAVPFEGLIVAGSRKSVPVEAKSGFSEGIYLARLETSNAVPRYCKIVRIK